MKKKLIIYCHGAIRLKDFIIIGKNLETNFDIVFITEEKKELKEIKKAGFICYNLFKLKTNRPLIKFRESAPASFKKLNDIKKGTIGQIISYFIYYIEHKVILRKVRKTFKLINADGIILASDRHPYPVLLSILSFAKKQGIKIIIPYVSNYHYSGTLTMLESNIKYKLLPNSSYAHKYIYSKHKKQMIDNTFYYQPFYYCVLKNLGITPDNPWFQGGGVSDLVFLNSETSLNESIENGINKEKLRIAAPPAYLSLLNAYKNISLLKSNFITKYKLNKKRIIIIALTQYFEHDMADKKTHFDIIHHTINSTLSETNNHSIIISLHPTMPYENYLFLEDIYDLKIANERLQDILPIADIYICGLSTTIEWSVILGIKTLVINYYKTNNYYDFLESIVMVKDKKQLNSMLKYILNNNLDFNNDWKKLNKETIFSNGIYNQYSNEIRNLLNN